MVSLLPDADDAVDHTIVPESRVDHGICYPVHSPNVEPVPVKINFLDPVLWCVRVCACARVGVRGWVGARLVHGWGAPGGRKHVSRLTLPIYTLP